MNAPTIAGLARHHGMAYGDAGRLLQQQATESGAESIPLESASRAIAAGWAAQDSTNTEGGA